MKALNLFRTDISTSLTAHDLLKTVALILMFVDHIAYYFMNDLEEMRLIGRLSSPIWFFLIGYAHTRKLEGRLWVWALILASGLFIIRDYQGLLPLNILFNFLFIRATLEFVMARATLDFEKLFGFFWVCVLLIIPSMWLFEYGSMGYLFAMAGYLVRHQSDLKNLQLKHVHAFMLLAVAAYGFGMWYQFKFDIENVIYMFIMLLCMCPALVYFKPHEFKSDKGLLQIIKYPLFLTGRRTLEIYVLHLLIFSYLARMGFSLM